MNCKRLKTITLPAILAALLLPATLAWADGDKAKKKTDDTATLGEEEVRTKTEHEGEAKTEKSAAGKALKTAYFHNQVEMRAGEIAQKKASSMEVREFADKLVEEHKKSQDELKTAANTLGIDLQTMDLANIDEKKMSDWKPEKQRSVQMLQKFEKASAGLEFDRMFVREMQAIHKDAIASLEKKTAEGKIEEAAVRDVIRGMIPSLRDHLAMAQRLEEQLGVATR